MLQANQEGMVAEPDPKLNQKLESLQVEKETLQQTISMLETENGELQQKSQTLEEKIRLIENSEELTKSLQKLNSADASDEEITQVKPKMELR